VNPSIEKAPGCSLFPEGMNARRIVKTIGYMRKIIMNTKGMVNIRYGVISLRIFFALTGS
jgi:hypothetical protein